MAPVQLAAVACTVALLAGLGIGLAANSGGGGDDGAAAVKPDGARLTRLAAPAIGAVDVPALKLPRSRGGDRVVTPPAAPPPPPTVVTPPPVVVTPPPPPPPPPGGPDVTHR